MLARLTHVCSLTVLEMLVIWLNVSIMLTQLADVANNYIKQRLCPNCLTTPQLLGDYTVPQILRKKFRHVKYA